MNITDVTSTPTCGTQFFCVWFICAEAEALRDIPSGHQHWQDFIVVGPVSHEEGALEMAAKLLEAKCEFVATITRVMRKAELERVLGLLNRVERGELRPASLADEDHLAWAERFLYDAEPGPAPSNAQ